MEVYQVAIRFVAVANEIVEHLPRGRAYLGDVRREIDVVDDDRFTAGRELLVRAVSMLVELTRSVGPGTGTGTGAGATDA